MFCDKCGTRRPELDPEIDSAPKATEAMPRQGDAAALPRGGQMVPAPGPGKRSFAARDHPVVAAGVLIAAVAVLAVLMIVHEDKGTGPERAVASDEATFPTSPSATVDPELNSASQSLDAYNSADSIAKNMISAYSSADGSDRCWVGSAADFPGQTLVTVIWSSGEWIQVDIDPVKGVDVYSLKNGPEYSLAGIDPASFDRTGYPCAVANGGEIRLLTSGA